MFPNVDKFYFLAAIMNGGDIWRFVPFVVVFVAQAFYMSRVYRKILEYIGLTTTSRTLLVWKYLIVNDTSASKSEAPIESTTYRTLTKSIVDFCKFNAERMTIQPGTDCYRRHKDIFEFEEVTVIGPADGKENDSSFIEFWNVFEGTKITLEYGRTNMCWRISHTDQAKLFGISKYLEQCTSAVPTKGIFEFHDHYWRNTGSIFYSDKNLQNSFYSKTTTKKISELLDSPGISLKKKFGSAKTISILAHGPPGTGKSSLATVLAAEKDCSLYVMPSEIKDAKEAFWMLPIDKPIVLVMNDFDITYGINRKKISSSDDISAKSGNLQFILNMLDQRRDNILFIVGTTNYPDVFDDAITRPGRFDNHLEMTYLDTETAVRILRHRFGDDDDKIKDIERQKLRIKDNVSASYMINKYMTARSTTVSDIISALFV